MENSRMGRVARMKHWLRILGGDKEEVVVDPKTKKPLVVEDPKKEYGSVFTPEAKK